MQFLVLFWGKEVDDVLEGVFDTDWHLARVFFVLTMTDSLSQIAMK